MKILSTKDFQNSDLSIAIIDKLSNIVFDAEKHNFCAVIENRKLDIESPVKLIFAKDKNGADIPLKPFDNAVFGAAVSEYNAGNEITTYGRIFHILGGGRDLRDAPSVQAAIADSLRKLRQTQITVDLTALVKNRKYKKYASKLELNQQYKGKIIIEGALLPTFSLSSVINGHLIEEGAIQFLDKSPLVKIAEMKGQITTIPQDLLDIPKLRCTVKTITLKTYLAERIVKSKGSNDKSRKHVCRLNKIILFDTIFSQLEIDDGEKWKKQDCRQNIKKILDHFVYKNFIKSYQFTIKNGKFYSIEFDF